jgi:hypothetical protein
VSLKVPSSLSDMPVMLNRFSKVKKAALPSDSVLDKHWIQTLGAKLSPQQAWVKLYGSVHYETDPVVVYTNGASLANGTPSAAAGS